MIPDITQPIFKTTLDVRISDINYGNHLGHDALISLLHEARLRFLKHFGYTEVNIEGYAILITALNVKYISEAFYANQLRIEIERGQVTPVRLELIYKVSQHETSKEVARATTTMAFYDYQTKKIVAVPTPLLTLLK